MKKNTAKNRQGFEASFSERADQSGSAHGRKSTHAAILRTLGNVLEAHGCSAYELRVENQDYVIKGKVPPVEKPTPSLLSSVRALFSRPASSTAEEKQTNEIELRYSHGDIEALEARVRAERKASPEAPDPQSTSQLLRGIGCYLDKRLDSILVSIAVAGRWVTIVSRNRAGHLQKSEQDIEYFYNLWVKMYLQRGDRPSETPQSDPTFHVTR